MALLDAAANAGVKVQTLAVQSTTLDDVFVYFTGRQLHGEQSTAAPDAPEVAAPAGR